MVLSGASLPTAHLVFQYSLCRVVLMVELPTQRQSRAVGLSVLALSSRFDGPEEMQFVQETISPFSTRSVESF